MTRIPEVSREHAMSGQASPAAGTTRRLGRLSIYTDEIGTWIEVTARRPLPVLVFLLIALAGWSMAGFVSVSMLFGSFGGPPAFSVFIAVWCSLWAAGWVAIAAGIVWMLAGREILILRDGVLTKRLVLPWVGITRDYAAELVSDPRRNEETGDPDIAQHEGVGFPLGRYGAVAFEHDGQTVYIGAALGPKAGDALLASLETWLARKEVAA